MKKEKNSKITVNEIFSLADKVLKSLYNDSKRMQLMEFIPIEENNDVKKTVISILLNDAYIFEGGQGEEQSIHITDKGVAFIVAGGYENSIKKEELRMQEVEMTIKLAKTQEKVLWLTFGVAGLTLIALIVQIFK